MRPAERSQVDLLCSEQPSLRPERPFQQLLTLHTARCTLPWSLGAHLCARSLPAPSPTAHTASVDGTDAVLPLHRTGVCAGLTLQSPHGLLSNIQVALKQPAHSQQRGGQRERLASQCARLGLPHSEILRCPPHSPRPLLPTRGCNNIRTTPSAMNHNVASSTAAAASATPTADARNAWANVASPDESRHVHANVALTGNGDAVQSRRRSSGGSACSVVPNNYYTLCVTL